MVTHLDSANQANRWSQCNKQCRTLIGQMQSPHNCQIIMELELAYEQHVKIIRHDLLFIQWPNIQKDIQLGAQNRWVKWSFFQKAQQYSIGLQYLFFLGVFLNHFNPCISLQEIHTAVILKISLIRYFFFFLILQNVTLVIDFKKHLKPALDMRLCKKCNKLLKCLFRHHLLILNQFKHFYFIDLFRKI